MMESRDRLNKQLGQYFSELDAAQIVVADLFIKQQACLAAPDAGELNHVTNEEVLAVAELQKLVERRSELLRQAGILGIPAANLRELASRLGESPETSADATQKLQHQSQALHQAGHSLWIACQKSLLHYGQLVQLIANGGRRPMITSSGKHHNPGGAILDASV